MAGLLAALFAVYLGAFGPRFRWRGALLLLMTMVATGVWATVQAAAGAHAAGLLFRVTPFSILLGLAEQALFVAVFYGLAALARWSHGELTGARARLPAE